MRYYFHTLGEPAIINLESENKLQCMLHSHNFRTNLWSLSPHSRKVYYILEGKGKKRHFFMDSKTQQVQYR